MESLLSFLFKNKKHSKPKDEETAEKSRKMSLGHARVISYEELKKATNNFDTELGNGGFGRVYLGKLAGQPVAVKVLFDRSSGRLEQFFNEVSVLSRIRHPNLVTLYGCTNPHGEELLLVYEFVPNGTVADHLHGQRSTLPWATRIQIAIETADALGYLHSLEPPIMHRDVKSANILLDNDFHVKVADLGMCRLLPWDTTQVSTMPQGTMGYRDPQYDLSGKLTDKSDVYSFGVMLVELISGQQAVDVNRAPDNVYLAGLALSKIVSKNLEEFVDKRLEYHSSNVVKSMIHSVAELARECLQPKGYMRPRMVEVVTTLKRIRDGLLEIHDEALEEADVVGRFTYEELYEATNSFDPSREISYGGLDKVYLGKFQSKQAVAVKVFSDQNLEQLKRMINEVTLISHKPHKNLLTLYGYTNESTPNMLLVYEYVPNGTVADHLHGKGLALTWSQRIQIATETAEGLAHLHSFKPPIIHRYMKTSNLLLDGAFHVKVSGLGMHHIYTASGHMLGYQDPMFELSHMLTEKSDVYSFGVFLVELICGKQAADVNPDTGEFQLVTMALSKIIDEELEMLVDPGLQYQSDSDVTPMIKLVAELACSCLRSNRKMRPSMAEAHMVLMRTKEDLDRILEKVDITAGLISTSEEELQETTSSKPQYTPQLAADDDPLPAIEGLQISGEAFPGRELQACGYSTNGTTSCNFEWVRYLEDGSIKYIEGAKQPKYLVTADDVDTYLAIEVQPLDNRKRKGELVKVFANNQRKITCDPEMQEQIERTFYVGHISYEVSLSTGYLDIWENAILAIQKGGYRIKRMGLRGVVVTEKFVQATNITIPYAKPTGLVIQCASGLEYLLSATGNSSFRDTIVLTMRLFKMRAIEKRQGKKKGLLFR